jgi:hypothetical protein
MAENPDHAAHCHRRKRARGAVRPGVRSRRTERQQSRDRRPASLRCRALAIAATRRAREIGWARRPAPHQGRRARRSMARRLRTQERNRADVRARLIELIAEAAIPPIPRRATRPSRARKDVGFDRQEKETLGAQAPARQRPRRRLNAISLAFPCAFARGMARPIGVAAMEYQNIVVTIERGRRPRHAQPAQGA